MSSSGPAADSASPPTLSTSLLEGAQRMDSDCWTRLVATFGPIVYGWSRASGIRETDSADIVQDVFVTVARGIGRFSRQKETGSFRSWLATITRSRVRDHLRRRAHEVDALGGTDGWKTLEQQADPIADPVVEHLLDSTINVTSADRALPQRLLMSVATEFETKTWQAFWRTTIDGDPVAQVATELQMSPASVYQAKSRVLRRLRQHLAELP